MRRALAGALCRFGHNRRGAVLVLFTIFLVPLIAVVAVGVDLSRLFLVKQKLISAADAAALAVGTRPGLTDAEARTMAEAFIRAHYAPGDFGNLQSFTVTPTNDQVDVAVTARIETTFLKVLNVSTLDVTVNSRVARAQRKVEVVLALDNTGSMTQPADPACTRNCVTKFDKLKQAANELINILFAGDAVSENVKIGLVPFSGAVNIGTDKLNSGWLDLNGLSFLQREDIDLLGGQTLLGLFSQITNIGWGGCVRARVGLNGYDLTDEPPNLANGETLFVPYFAPDEPDTPGGYNNNYLNDLIVGSAIVRQRFPGKYLGALIAGNSPGPNRNCVPRPIQALTNVKQTITDAINAMSASGNTVIPEGLAWGWRVLSPGSPFAEGAPYGDGTTLKILILLTDGRNQVEASNGHNHSVYSAYGYAASGHIGPTDGSGTRQALDDKTAALCNNIKADKDGDPNTQDIYLYTISYALLDQAARNLLQACATPQAACPGNNCYYDVPDPAALSGAFTSIAMGINQLRLTR
jgi:Flp pilus assembly protein TadG